METLKRKIPHKELKKALLIRLSELLNESKDPWVDPWAVILQLGIECSKNRAEITINQLEQDKLVETALPSGQMKKSCRISGYGIEFVQENYSEEDYFNSQERETVREKLEIS